MIQLSETARLAPAPRTPRILIIDDDPIFTEIIEHVGFQNGLYVHSCGVDDLLDSVELDGYDLIVIDYRQGDTNGLNISKKLAQRQVEAPILLVSGGQEVLSLPGWPDNIRGFASKEIGPLGILESIRLLLAG